MLVESSRRVPRRYRSYRFELQLCRLVLCLRESIANLAVLVSAESPHRSINEHERVMLATSNLNHVLPSEHFDFGRHCNPVEILHRFQIKPELSLVGIAAAHHSF